MFIDIEGNINSKNVHKRLVNYIWHFTHFVVNSHKF